MKISSLRFTAASAFAIVLGTLAIPGALGADPGDVLVTNGSNPNVFSQNKQNEPAVAVDANHPNVVVAGANDNIDMEGCNVGDDTTCPFTQGVGVSGVYFSFDGGHVWTQPTYSGYSARACLGVAGTATDTCAPNPHGQIGTLPKYAENGLVSDGDPALAFGPVPDSSGHFSWDNGSRLYYANLTSNIGATRSESAFRGYEALAVSRTDDVVAAAEGGPDGQAAWMAPVIVTRQASTTFMDKEQIWADNASSSPNFGTVYVCSVAFRSNSQGHGAPAPLIVATSRDGGTTWTERQLSPAQSPAHAGWSGCTVRTDSHGRAYVFFAEFALGFPGNGWHVMSYSDNAGETWTRPVQLFHAVDLCNAFDPVIGRCVEDGVAGARDDLGPAPSIDIANGAPTGLGATNEVVDAWADGRAGLNNEQVLFSSSTGGGLPGTWSTPRPVQGAGDRALYAAPAISPDGKDVYVVYNAFTNPWRTDTTSVRGLVGVLLHADVAADGTVGTLEPVHRGDVGDPRASSQNNLAAEFLGDYVYAAATDDYGVAVWNDVRNGTPCDAINEWRASLRTSTDPIPTGVTREREGDEDDGPTDAPGDVPTPAPMVACLDTGTGTTFGNTDIYASNYPDPTPDAAAPASAPGGAAPTAGPTNGNGSGEGKGKNKPAKGPKK
jgi:hypothetical protein